MYLNCDLGEGCGDDAALMPLIDQASIACGGHAGDDDSMRATAHLAAKHGVTIGAHPSYPDREGFGRRSLSLSADALHAALRTQVQALVEIAGEAGQSVRYCKPHGALYHDMLSDDSVAKTLARVAVEFELPLVVPAGAQASAIAHIADQTGIALWTEAFADRGYGDDGRLLPRSLPGAVLTAESAATQVRELLDGWLVVPSGRHRSAHADTICVHGDTPQAVAIARAVREAIQAST